MPRFVVLEHDHPVLHWDLMLDVGDVLRTWRLAEAPRPGLQTNCEALPDHRRMYLDYEGPVSGDRGSVRRVLAGDYDIIQDEPEGVFAELHAEGFEGLIQIAPAEGHGVAMFIGAGS
jgi:hypothetical protein